MGATAGWPTASARRANALVIGRWCGVAALFYPLTWQLFTHPNLRAVAALGSAALVAAVNFLQRHFLVSLQANAGETSRAALRTQASLVTRIRALGRVLLALDAALVVLAALALADEPSGGFWALLGWLPVEGAIAEGTVTAVITGTLAVGAVIAYDAVARGGMPSFSPGSGLLVRVLELAGVTGVMIGLERTLSKGERIMTQRHDELTGLVDREREARAELEAFSTIVLAGVAHQGNLEGALQSMTKAVASNLDYERMAVFVIEGNRLRLYSWFGDWTGGPSRSLPVGPGSIVGRVATSGTSVLVEDPARTPDYFATARDTKSEVCVPIRFGDRVLGAVNVESPRPDAYSRNDLARLQRLADQMAVVVDNARLFDAQSATADRESAARREIEAVSRAVVASVKVGTYQAALDRMLAEVAEVLGGTASELAVPVRLEGKMLGVLTAKSSQPEAFDADEMTRLSRIADQLAMVIERARLAEGEAETTARLRLLDQMRDDFVAMTTHEQRHLIQVIDRQTARLARLVEDLLLVSRMQAGMLEVSLAVYDPVELLTDYNEEWPKEPAPVFLDMGHDLPNVRTDPDRLAQVMRNLVDNAQRYGGGSPIRVSARRAVRELLVEVKDQGPGIDAAELPYVFERFRQAGSSSAHRAGMGLGLYITKQLVHALGGSIEVESSPGRGTTFRVRLPGERARSLPARISNVSPFQRRRQAPGG